MEISPVAAPLLNKTFKTDAVKPGLLVGIAKIDRQHHPRRLIAAARRSNRPPRASDPAVHSPGVTAFRQES